MAGERFFFGVHCILPLDPICLRPEGVLEDRHNSLCCKFDVVWLKNRVFSIIFHQSKKSKKMQTVPPPQCCGWLLHDSYFTEFWFEMSPEDEKCKYYKTSHWEHDTLECIESLLQFLKQHNEIDSLLVHGQPLLFETFIL